MDHTAQYTQNNEVKTLSSETFCRSYLDNHFCSNRVRITEYWEQPNIVWSKMQCSCQRNDSRRNNVEKNRERPLNSRSGRNASYWKKLNKELQFNNFLSTTKDPFDQNFYKRGRSLSSTRRFSAETVLRDLLTKLATVFDSCDM